MWSNVGTRYYEGPSGLMAVSVATAPELTLSVPRPVLADPVFMRKDGFVHGYDVAPDGETFVGLATGEPGRFDELRRLVP